SNRATLALACGDYTRAGELSDELRATAARAAAPDQLREAELNQALVALRTGRLKRAMELLDLLGEWADLAADRRLQALVLLFRSEAACRCGKPSDARKLARAALDHAAAQGQPHIVVEAELALAQADLAQGRAEDAADHLHRCRQSAADLSYVRPELHARLLLAQLDAPAVSAAQSPWDELLAELTAHGLADLHVEASLLQAQSLLPTEAVPVLTAAAESARRLGYFWGAHAALLALVQSHLTHGNTAAAHDAFAQAQTLRKRRLGRLTCRPLKAAEQTVSDSLSATAPSPAPNTDAPEPTHEE
ncbi:MAG: hypothetical protein KKI08_25230, partial [Armatimonadetes bacterium]|nr:hypothetical protein [Armatimonadota bacterium]